MTNVYDVLETCLEEIENGADVELVLLHYPDFAQELRPILQAAEAAKGLSPSDPSEEVVRRNRAKVLQHAAEMREERMRAAPGLNWIAPLRRLAVRLAILVLVFVSGTNLVGAASTSLPGEELYPVKRSWERLQVIFLLDTEAREALEVEHENERIEELLKLFAGNRSAEVMFNGLVTIQNGNEWLVAGIRVQIAPGAELPEQAVHLNSPVRVHGSTQTDGSVLATKIELLSAGESLPEVEDDSRGEQEGKQENENESNSGSGEEEAAPALDTTPDPDSVKFDGVLNVHSGDFWTINGVPSDVSNAELIGTPSVGASVTVEGYFNSEGVFIVTKIKFEETGGNSGSGSNSNTNSNDNGNISDDSNNNNTGSENDNDNDNDADDDNSGSGGGDD